MMCQFLEGWKKNIFFIQRNGTEDQIPIAHPAFVLTISAENQGLT